MQKIDYIIKIEFYKQNNKFKEIFLNTFFNESKQFLFTLDDLLG